MVDALALMVAPEPWGLHNWCLQNLLRETFSRLIQQNRVYAFYPAGTNDPTALVFNTGLVTPQLVALYALVVPSASRSAVVPNWMKGVPWMVTNFYDEAQLTDAANWVAIRRRCATLSQTLHAAALLATDMPKRATYVDDDLGQIFSSYDGRIPIADQHVRTGRSRARSRARSREQGEEGRVAGRRRTWGRAGCVHTQTPDPDQPPNPTFPPLLPPPTTLLCSPLFPFSLRVFLC